VLKVCAQDGKFPDNPLLGPLVWNDETRMAKVKQPSWGMVDTGSESAGNSVADGRHWDSLKPFKG
jgi:hypothetical protein